MIKPSEIWLEFHKLIEAVVQRCSVKEAFLKIWINSQENTCARVSFLIKLQASVLIFCDNNDCKIHQGCLRGALQYLFVIGQSSCKVLQYINMMNLNILNYPLNQTKQVFKKFITTLANSTVNKPIFETFGRAVNVTRILTDVLKLTFPMGNMTFSCRLWIQLGWTSLSY